MDPETKKYLDDQHVVIFQKIGNLELQIAPITKVYNSVNGFGNVASWMFKIVVIPFSIVIGIWYEIKRGIHGL